MRAPETGGHYARYRSGHPDRARSRGQLHPHVARRIVERMNATFIHVAGRPAVHLERPFPYPAERVWSTLTVPDESARWFPSRLTIEPRVGGTVTFTGDPNTPDSAGTVRAYSPQQLVAFSWGSNELRFVVTATTPKECVLKLTDTLTAENEAARNAAGWDICLAQLDVYLAGHESDGSHGASAPSWQERYDHYVELGLPSGAMIPGMSSPEHPCSVGTRHVPSLWRLDRGECCSRERGCCVAVGEIGRLRRCGIRRSQTRAVNTPAA